MNKLTTSAALALVCFTVSGFAADTATKIAASDPNTVSRAVSYHKGEFIAIPTQIGYPTLVELPPKEKALTPICGTCKALDDKGGDGGPEDWIIQIIPDSNLVAIQPLKAGVKTVAHILGSSGAVYTFSLSEVSHLAGAHADVRISIGNSDAPVKDSLIDVARFVSAEKVDVYKQQAVAAEKALEDEKEKDRARQATEKEAAREKVEAGIKHTYRWDANSKSDKIFNVKSMYESDGFTVIEASPQESPAVYEKKDGKDSLIEYRLEDGRYVIPKIVSDGYLRVGKSKLTFHREG